MCCRFPSCKATRVDVATCSLLGECPMRLRDVMWLGRTVGFAYVIGATIRRHPRHMPGMCLMYSARLEFRVVPRVDVLQRVLCFVIARSHGQCTCTHAPLLLHALKNGWLVRVVSDERLVIM